MDTGWGFKRALAKHFGVSHASIQDWLDVDKGYPKLKFLLKMSEDTGFSINDLLAGNISDSNKSATKNGNPVFSLQDVDRFFNNSIEDIDSFLDIDLTLKEGQIAIKQTGDSMTSSLGNSFPGNTIIIFDTIFDAVDNNSLVLAKTSEGNFVFRKYISEDNEFLLCLNNNYPPYTSQFKIMGIFSCAIIL